MKRLFGLFLSFLILISSVSAGFSVFAADDASGREDTADEKRAEIAAFSNELSEVIGKYDEGKDFVLPSELEEEQKYTSTVLHAQAPLTTDEDGAVTEDEKYTYTDFQTCRLIVDSDSYFSKRGAVAVVDGYEDMHVLQYETAADTLKAYEYYCDKNTVTSVEPDFVYELDEGVSTVDLSSYDDGSDFPSPVSWGNERIHAEDAKEYILQDKSVEDLPEIVIGVIDSGITTGINKYFTERVIAAYTFAVSGGDPDFSFFNHGNLVAGVIIDNTLPNVKIISYQVFDINKYTNTSITRLACEQAIIDGVDVINCSYAGPGSSGERTAVKHGIVVAAGAGNDDNATEHYPAADADIIGVAAMNNKDKRADFSCYGPWVEVAAPGVDIRNVSALKEGISYKNWNGTSAAAPFVSAACAMILTQHPTFSVDVVKECLFNTCEKLDDIKYTIRYGLINMLAAVSYYDTSVRQTAAPTFSLESRPAEGQVYTEAQYLELSCADEGAQFYYTTDRTYPSKKNGTLYTGPIELKKWTEVWAIAYSDAYFTSTVSKRSFWIQVPVDPLPNENGWSITDAGLIRAYYGADMNPVAPDTVLGITVTGVDANTFKDNTMFQSITLPATAVSIGDSAFEGCDYLTSVTAPGLTSVGKRAFYNCYNLDEVSMPLLTTLSERCFYNCGTLIGMPFDNFVTVPKIAFSSTEVVHVSLPNAVKIQNSAFNSCKSLISLSAPKLEEGGLGSSVFESCTMLETVELSPDVKYLSGSTFSKSGVTQIDFLPDIEEIYNGDFSDCDNLSWVKMKSVKTIDSYTFRDSKNLVYAEFPSVTMICGEAFSGCSSLSELILSDCLEWFEGDAFKNTPSLTYVQLNGLTYGNQILFDGSSITRVEFNKIVTLEDLPDTKGSIIALPSTFETCTMDTAGKNYRIYGTKGTTAETWALANGHEFIEVAQDTAIVKDVVEEYDSVAAKLSFDVIGFNRAYQWYGCADANRKNSVAIEGATCKDFIPAEFTQYPYYYCVVTSTDEGCAPVTIISGLSQNILLQSADYTAYNAAVTQANALDRSLYTDLTALDDALAVDVSGKNITEQIEVDIQTQAILNAIEALTYKPADYTEYNAAVAQANALDPDLYVDFTAVEEALSADVSGKNITEQSAVDEQTQAILNAIGELEPIGELPIMPVWLQILLMILALIKHLLTKSSE